MKWFVVWMFQVNKLSALLCKIDRAQDYNWTGGWVVVNKFEHLDERKHSKAYRNHISFFFENLFSFIVCNPVCRYVCDDKITK
jgi:hypothetical protein